jgi:UPF0755 protein
MKIKIRHLITAFAAILLCTLVWTAFSPHSSDEVAFKVAKGDNATAIAHRLKEHGIIRSQTMFKLLATLRGTDRRLKAGTYTLGGGHSLYQTLILLEKGNISAVRVTIPEGLSLYKTLQRIERSGLASFAELNAIATDTLAVRQLTGTRARSLEGFLYPETYSFNLDSEPREFLKAMVDEFQARLSEAGVDPAATPGFYNKLVLASIVEKESNFEDERPIVASVMYNRLEAGMRLSSCSTVDYVLERQGVKKPVLSIQDTQIQSPYNTYANFGLPPGPICNPSLSSILAVLNPAQTDFYYFVADRKGRNDFSASAEEHSAKVKRYRRSEWE